MDRAVHHDRLVVVDDSHRNLGLFGSHSREPVATLNGMSFEHLLNLSNNQCPVRVLRNSNVLGPVCVASLTFYILRSIT